MIIGTAFARGHARLNASTDMGSDVILKTQAVLFCRIEFRGGSIHPNPKKRYDSVSAFLHALTRPNAAFKIIDKAPLLERNPHGFWRNTAIFFFLFSQYLAYLLSRQ